MKNNPSHRYAGYLTVLVLLLAGVNTVLLSERVNATGDGEKEASEMTIAEVLKERAGALMSVRGVVGVGQGLCNGRACVKVYVEKKTPEVEEEIGRILEPHPFGIQESGRFQSR